MNLTLAPTPLVAILRGVTPDEIARQTTANFFRLFNKVPQIAVTAA